jgi:hypothetical protein
MAFTRYICWTAFGRVPKLNSVEAFKTGSLDLMGCYISVDGENKGQLTFLKRMDVLVCCARE